TRRGHARDPDRHGIYRLGLWDDEVPDRLQSRYDMLDDIVSTGKIADEEAFRRALAEFADAFEPTVDDEAEPDVTDPGSASRALVDSDITLPEEDISRRDEGDQ
ncbi:MAG: F0F1 ATP synthase subunit alpha, partial [Acidobacteria bacterium]|nr:F0F1 ATP synthase subunit alpha [Acidobacteriota bacterium]